MSILKVWPWQEEPEFNPLSPQLAESTMSSEDKAKLFQEVCLSVILVPLVGKGASAEQDLKHMSKVMGDSCKEASRQRMRRICQPS